MADKKQNCSLLTLFLTLFKIGAFTFGGGYAMIPLIQREVVEDKKWLSNDEFVDIIALVQTAPGAVAINTAVFLGYRLRKLKGALVAVIGVALPSFLIILLIASVFISFETNPIVQKALMGIRPAIVSLLVYTIYHLGKRVIKKVKEIALFGLSFFGILMFNIHPIIVLITAGLIGYFTYEDIENIEVNDP
ncbi:MAG: chromate transporter [Thermosediminibacterales bacterium]|nr:chromate transporter [Thermosediminibacterales bacterium]